MAAPALPFLENFYTGVTLYMPEEPIVNSPALSQTEISLAPEEKEVLLTVLAAKSSLEPSHTTPVTTEADATVSVSPAMLTPFRMLGDRPNGVILLFRLPDEQFQKLPRNVFLNNMLKALGLVIPDVMLVNVESELVVTLAGLRTEMAATRIIAFGRNLLDVALRTTQIYEPVQFQALNLSFLASATVDSVEYDVSLKKRLWPGLQRMFLR